MSEEKAKNNNKGFLVKKTVLIVDDEEINVEIMSAILEDTFNILTANDGKEALDILLLSGRFAWFGLILR